MPELPQLPHEKVLQLLQANANAVAACFPEAHAIVISVVYDPKIANDNMPAGTLAIKPGLELTPDLIMRAVQQNARLGAILLNKLEPPRGQDPK